MQVLLPQNVRQHFLLVLHMQPHLLAILLAILQLLLLLLQDSCALLRHFRAFLLNLSFGGLLLLDQLRLEALQDRVHAGREGQPGVLTQHVNTGGVGLRGSPAHVRSMGCERGPVRRFRRRGVGDGGQR